MECDSSIVLSAEQAELVSGTFKSSIETGVSYNSTNTGGGKTVCTIRLAELLSEHHGEPCYILVVGPATANKICSAKHADNSLSPWRREALNYGHEDVCFTTTYEKLRGPGITAKEDSIEWVSKSISPFTDFSGTDMMTKLGYYNKEFQQSSDVYHELVAEGEMLAEHPRLPPYERNGYKLHWGYPTDNCVVQKIDTLVAGRSRTKSEKLIYETYYTPGIPFMHLLMTKLVLIVADECDSANGNSLNNRVLAALFRAVGRAWHAKGNTGAYIALLSATPMHATHHAANYFKLLGRYNPVGRLDMTVGPREFTAQEAYREAQRFNKDVADEIAQRYKMFDKKGDLKTTTLAKEKAAIDDFWTKCVLTRIQFATIDIVECNLCNGFFNVDDPDDLEHLYASQEHLENALAAKKAGRQGDSFREETAAQQESELGMINTLVRRTIGHYTENEYCKVALIVNRIESVYELQRRLLAKGIPGDAIVTISGDEEEADIKRTKRTSNQRHIDRQNAINKFQTHRRVRIVVASKQSIIVGIRLDDRIGGRNRYAYIIPSCNIRDNKQAAGRIFSFGNQSVSTIFMCYPKIIGPNVIRLYNAIVNASSKMRQALEANNSSRTDAEEAIYKMGIRLPGEYDRYIEPYSKEFEDRAYLWDVPKMYNIPGDYVGLYPPPEAHGFIEEDTEEARALYADNAYMIEYVHRMWEQGLGKDDVPGIYFKTPVDPDYNQFPPEVYPSIVLLDEVI